MVVHVNVGCVLYNTHSMCAVYMCIPSWLHIDKNVTPPPTCGGGQWCCHPFRIGDGSSLVLGLVAKTGGSGDAGGGGESETQNGSCV